MYIAMNQFNVVPEREADFERIWKERESFLAQVPGFVQFALLRGDHVGEYVSHSMWQDKDAFLAWTQSEAFVKGHRQGESLQTILAGPPKLATFQAVIEETAEHRYIDDSQPDAARQPIHG
jgi:heme-degrading monooxygenase HmoA